jgi:hypothetical protein
MEYLTLHDIPQRHCNPVHSHRMASQSSERPVAHMAAVCDIFSFHSTPNPEKRSLFLPSHSPRGSDLYAHILGNNRSAQRQHLLKENTLPQSSSPSRSADPSFPLTSPDRRMGLHCPPDHSPERACAPAAWDEYLEWCSAKRASQNHLQRSSPPLQPGEQNFPGKLPSFDEVSTVLKLTLRHADPCSSSKQQLRGPHHTHHREGMSPWRTLHMCALSSMM